MIHGNSQEVNRIQQREERGSKRTNELVKRTCNQHLHRCRIRGRQRGRVGRDRSPTPRGPPPAHKLERWEEKSLINRWGELTSTLAERTRCTTALMSRPHPPESAPPPTRAVVVS